MGIPSVVGCINATSKIKTGDKITLSCAERDTSFIYVDELDFTVTKSEIKDIPKLHLKL